jgi:hypothetical protein
MPEYKYEKIKNEFKPVRIDLPAQQAVAVAVNSSKRKDDGQIFADAQFMSGYIDAFGSFRPNKFNGRVNIPAGITKEQWLQLYDSIVAAQKEAEKVRTSA